jgi:serine/threonine-protein kinase
VLYEMLTGRLLFPGETITDTLAAVVRAEPDWRRLPERTPPGMRRVLRLCLVKDPRGRLNDIGDALLLMGGDAEDDRVAAPAAVAAEPGRSPWRERVAWALAALATVAVIAMVVTLGLRPSTDESPTPTRFTIQLPNDAPLLFRDEPVLAFAPDGSMIAFVAQDPQTENFLVFLRAIDQSEPWPLPGTEDASNPFFSPDGKQLGFFAAGELRRIALSGGSPVTLAEAATPRGGVWLPDGRIVYSPEYTGGLWQVPASGGLAEPLVELDSTQGERTHRWPTVFGDGEAVMFTVGSEASPNNYDHAGISVLSLEDGTRHDLLQGANMARFVAPDKLVFSRAGTLFAVGVDPQRFEIHGEPVRVMDEVGGDPSSGAGYFDLSPAGDLTWVASSITDAKAKLVLVDRQGQAEPLPIEPRGFHQPNFSPDGSKLAFTVGGGPLGINGDIWVYSFADRGLRRVTFGGSDLYPIWNPDGSRITFVSASDTSINSKAADGSGEVKKVADISATVMLPTSWSPDGRTLALTLTSSTNNVYLLDPDGGEPRLFAEDASAPMISPDGRWLAYGSPASGKSTIFVEPVEGEGKWQVSPEYGAYPRWSADGRKLFFIDNGRQERPMMEVDVDPGETFHCSMPRVVVPDTTRYVTTTAPMINWDTDGERFVFVELQRDDETLLRVEVMLDWASRLSLAPSE